MQKSGKEMWYNPELELSRYTEKKLRKEITDYIRENKRRLFLEWEEADYDELEKMVKFGSMLLQYHVEDDIEDEDRLLLFEIGTLKGIVACFEHLLYEKGQQLRIEEKMSVASRSIKYFNRVVEALMVYKRITHTDLCNKLKLKPSTLTEAMKKILPTQMIQATYAGKYKIYSLTDIGMRYARYRRREGNEKREAVKNGMAFGLWQDLGGVVGASKVALNVRETELNEMAVLPGDKIKLHSSNSYTPQEFKVNNILKERDEEGLEKKHLFLEGMGLQNTVGDDVSELIGARDSMSTVA